MNPLLHFFLPYDRQDSMARFSSLVACCLLALTISVERPALAADDGLPRLASQGHLEPASFLGHAAAVSPDDRYIAIQQKDGLAIVEIQTGKLLRNITGFSLISSFAFCNDGTSIIISGFMENKPVTGIWDAGSGRLLRKILPATGQQWPPTVFGRSSRSPTEFFMVETFALPNGLENGVFACSAVSAERFPAECVPIMKLPEKVWRKVSSRTGALDGLADAANPLLVMLIGGQLARNDPVTLLPRAFAAGTSSAPVSAFAVGGNGLVYATRERTLEVWDGQTGELLKSALVPVRNPKGMQGSVPNIFPQFVTDDGRLVAFDVSFGLSSYDPQTLKRNSDMEAVERNYQNDAESALYPYALLAPLHKKRSIFVENRKFFGLLDIDKRALVETFSKGVDGFDPGIEFARFYAQANKLVTFRQSFDFDTGETRVADGTQEVFYSDDGLLQVVLDEPNQRLRLSNARTGAAIRDISLGYAVRGINHVRISADHHFMFFNPDLGLDAPGISLLLDLQSAQSRAVGQNMFPIAVNRDGVFLANANGNHDTVAGRFKADGTLELKTLACYFDLGHSNAIGDSAYFRYQDVAVRGAQDVVQTRTRIDICSAGGRVRSVVADGHLNLLGEIGANDYSPATKMFAIAAMGDSRISLVKPLKNGAAQIVPMQTPSVVKKIRFTRDGTRLLTFHADYSVILWDLASQRQMLKIVLLNKGWVVFTPDGRFDVSGFDDSIPISWILESDPFHAFAFESFMKDYYEPRLFQRVLLGEKFAQLRPPGTLNLTQPDIQIESIAADTQDPALANVTVKVHGGRQTFVRDGVPVESSTAANDLRLFRDGQLVGALDGVLVGPDDDEFSKVFSVRVPPSKTGQRLDFSAYAFNDDRVKTATSRLRYSVPADLPQQKPQAVILSIGVNRYENPKWDLDFAAGDARLISSALQTSMESGGKYRSVVAKALVSDDANPTQASKNNIRQALQALSGKQDDSTLADLPILGPDDVLIISFSGHGYVDDSGRFYIVPHDIGPPAGSGVTTQVLEKSISSDELALWLRDVDAADIVLVVDACHSAASVARDGFKPGPMGSRGLGQLAYDKGLRILAATQADDVALESEAAHQGLLSYALINDGTRAGLADFKPRDGRITVEEWLTYAVKRVPALSQEILTGQFAARSGPTVKFVRTRGQAKPSEARGMQQPALFDFRKSRVDTEILGGR